MKSVERKIAPATLRVEDGKGGFLTLNTADFVPGVHTRYEVKLVELVELVEEKPEPVVEEKPEPVVEDIVVKNYSVRSIGALLAHEDARTIQAYKDAEDARIYPRKRILSIIDDALKARG